MRRWFVPASLLLAACPAVTALADGNCPPGSWFCEETPVQPPPQQADDDNTPPTATNPQEAPAPPHRSEKGHKKHPAPAQAPAAQGSVTTNGTQIQASGDVQIQASGPVVIYTQNGQQVITQPEPSAPPAAPSPPARPAPPARRLVPWREHFGLNLRVEGAGFASAGGGRVGMGGAGISMRWRPARAFALDVGLDILGGNDYYAKTRIESAVSMTGMIFFNPKSLFQIYALGGFHVSHAEIEQNNSCLGGFCGASTDTTGRDYIGLHGGLGVELRLAKHFGIDVDGLGIIRTGIGNGPPEFTNPKTGQTSDTSGAGVVRGGVTFWW